MIRKLATAAALVALLPIAMACQSDGDEAAAAADAKAATTSSAETSAATPGAGGSSMIRVSLQNVAGDLATQLQVERTAIPANAQASLEVAAGVCGVSAKILATPTGEQAACAAKTVSAELAQLVQQQITAGTSDGVTPPPATPN